MRRDTVLLVDDQPFARRLYREVLEPLGCDLREAADGREAIESAAKVRPDLVVLDLEMPGCDGFTVCRRLKADAATRLSPVIVVSSNYGLPDRLRAIEAGADEFLSKPFAISEFFARVRASLASKRFTDELEPAAQVLEAMALAVERRDPCTGGHCRRLAALAGAVGESFGLDAEELRTLRLGALLHDVGKVAVPDAVLLKPGRLDAAEAELMRRHPIVGCEMCEPLRSMRSVIPLVRHHHEKLDGSGYPDGLRGSQIPLAVRILSVADVYDALTSDRPYKRAYPPGEALRILREEVDRGWWDREVVARLAGVVGSGAEEIPG